MMQETDLELLEFAAKAAGIELDYTIRPDGKAFYHSERNALATVDGGWFAPLTDDGDALRLAVKLRLVVHVWDDGSYVSVAKTLPDGDDPPSDDSSWNSCSVEEDFYSAARRAIVRCAAEIGKAM